MARQVTSPQSAVVPYQAKLAVGGLLRILGSDARRWLHSIVTQDLSSLEDVPFLDSFLLKPTGQILAELRLWAHDGGVTVATAQPNDVRAAVSRFVILEDVAIETLGDLWTVQGESGECMSPRTENVGYDTVSPVDKIRSLSPKEWDRLTLEAGIAGTAEFALDVFPQELGDAALARTVARNKGCYLGQEVVERIRSRGHVNRSWRRVSCQSVLPRGAKLTGQDGAPAGVVTRSVPGISGALLKSGFAVAGQLLLCDGVEARVL